MPHDFDAWLALGTTLGAGVPEPVASTPHPTVGDIGGLTLVTLIAKEYVDELDHQIDALTDRVRALTMTEKNIGLVREYEAFVDAWKRAIVPQGYAGLTAPVVAKDDYERYRLAYDSFVVRFRASGMSTTGLEKSRAPGLFGWLNQQASSAGTFAALAKGSSIVIALVLVAGVLYFGGPVVVTWFARKSALKLAAGGAA